MPFGITFNFAPVSIIQFIATLGAAAAVIIAFGLYLLIYIGYFGQPMFKYLSAKFNPGTGIIQEYIHENVILKTAQVNNGEFISIEAGTPIKTNKHFWEFWKPSVIYQKDKPLLAQSITSINGTQTLMVWNVTPPLPERYLNMLESLVNAGYKSIDELAEATQAQDGPRISLDGLIPGLKDKVTIQDFLTLHAKVRDRNAVIVTPHDILNFSETYMDEHAKKSVIEKEVTIQTKRLSDSKYQTYAFYIIALMVIAGFFLKIYKMKYGGG